MFSFIKKCRLQNDIHPFWFSFNVLKRQERHWVGDLRLSFRTIDNLLNFRGTYTISFLCICSIRYVHSISQFTRQKLCKYSWNNFGSLIYGMIHSQVYGKLRYYSFSIGYSLIKMKSTKWPLPNKYSYFTIHTDYTAAVAFNKYIT